MCLLSRIASIHINYESQNDPFDTTNLFHLRLFHSIEIHFFLNKLNSLFLTTLFNELIWFHVYFIRYAYYSIQLIILFLIRSHYLICDSWIDWNSKFFIYMYIILYILYMYINNTYNTFICILYWLRNVWNKPKRTNIVINYTN